MDYQRVKNEARLAQIQSSMSHHNEFAEFE